MFFASFLIGLREGLEAALIIGILIAYVHKLGRDDVKRRIWWGVWIAVILSLGLGALFTFGRYGLSFFGQEVIGGSMSLLAVAMVTWMVFWMMRTGSRLKQELQEGVDRALLLGAGWSIFWLSFVSVAREGIETTLMLWGWSEDSLVALAGAVVGIIVAVGIGYLLNKGMMRIDLGVFFSWTGAFLIIVTAGILAYGIHDLQEAAVLPGPFSGHPITPTDLRTGDVLVGVTNGPYWMAAYPFGWAFNLEDVIDPSGLLAAFLKGTIGFVPLMTWLEVTAWAIYLLVVFPIFFRKVREDRAAKRARAELAAASASAATPEPVTAAAPPGSAAVETSSEQPS